MKSKHRLFRVGARVLAGTRADRWLAPLARGRGVILAFHRVRPPRREAFEPLRYLEITPDYLERIVLLARAQGFEPVSLDAVPGRLAGSGGPPFVAFTFDDGYRDNLEHAMPVLSRHGVPWTVFVTATFASGHGRLWWYELERAVARLERVRVEVGGRVLDLPARGAAQKRRAFDALYRRLHASPGEVLLRAAAGLAAAAGVDPGALARDLCLSWEELRALSRRDGVTIGAHTVTHPSLARLPYNAAVEEIRKGRDAIRERLGIEVRHFAFPFGGPSTAGPREVEIAREAGFRTTLTTRPGHVFQDRSDPHALPRVQVSGLFQTDAALRAILSGVPFLLPRRGRGAAAPVRFPE